MNYLLAYTVLIWAVVAAYFARRFLIKLKKGEPAYRITMHIAAMASTPIVLVGQQFGWFRANFAVAYIATIALQGTSLLFEIWDTHRQEQSRA